MKVSIDKIVAGMEFCNEDSIYYYNPKTNDIFCTSCIGDIYGIYDKNEREDLIESGIPLPTQYEINEYSMMENFTKNIENEHKANKLNDSLNGRGAFRRFKDCVYNLNLEDKWFKFRNNKYKKIAIEWCKDNDLDFIDDYEIKE